MAAVGHGTVNSYFHDRREPDGTEGERAQTLHIEHRDRPDPCPQSSAGSRRLLVRLAGLNQILGEDFWQCVEWPFRVGKRWRSADPASYHWWLRRPLRIRIIRAFTS